MRQFDQQRETSKFPVKESIVALALLLYPGDADAQSPELSRLATLPASCSLGDTTSPDCTRDLTEQAGKLSTFISKGGLSSIGFFKRNAVGLGGLKAEDRCKAALELLEPRKEQLEDILNFFERDAERPDSKEPMQKLFPGTFKHLRAEKGDKEPTQQEVVERIRKNAQTFPEELRQCGTLLYSTLTFAGIGFIESSAKGRAPILIDRLTKGIQGEPGSEHFNASVKAYVGLLDALKAAADMRGRGR